MIEICSLKKKNHVKALKAAGVFVDRQSFGVLATTLGPHLWNNLVTLETPVLSTRLLFNGYGLLNCFQWLRIIDFFSWHYLLDCSFVEEAD